MQVSENFLVKMNQAYQQLEIKLDEILEALKQAEYKVDSGWHNGHYNKDSNGEWQRDSYPIPVVGVKGVCDIEISFEGISVSTKFKRDAALAYSHENILEYTFEVYGVNDYLGDYYHNGMTIQELKDNIESSNEEEIAYQFIFSLAVQREQFGKFLHFLVKNGFYY